MGIVLTIVISFYGDPGVVVTVIVGIKLEVENVISVAIKMYNLALLRIVLNFFQ